MEFKRFVSYVYGYRQNEKQENCGFVKVEVRQNMARFIVHIYLPGKRELEYKIYGFVRKEQRLEGIMLGVGKVKSGNLDVRIHRNAENLGTEEVPEEEKITIEQLAGLLVIGADQSVYGTVWDDGTIDVSSFIKPSQKARIEEVEEKVQEVDLVETDSVEERKEDVIEADSIQERKEDVIETDSVDGSNEVLHMEEITTKEPCPNNRVDKPDSNHRTSDNREICHRKERMDWETLQNLCPWIYPFEVPRDGQYLRIQPKDMKHFSKELWHLGSNSFLLHGYYNYRYLIVGREPKGMLLGIPGNYDPKEESIAAMFGFPAFLPAQRQNQGNTRFGYWCRWI